MSNEGKLGTILIHLSLIHSPLAQRSRRPCGVAHNPSLVAHPIDSNSIF